MVLMKNISRYLFVFVILITIKDIPGAHLAHSICDQYDERRTNYLQTHKELSDLNTNYATTIEIAEPLIQNLESNSAEYPREKIDSMLSLKYANIKLGIYPIYEIDPFEQLGINLLTTGRPTFLKIQRAGICYSSLLSAKSFMFLLKSANKETNDFLKSTNETHINVLKNDKSKCNAATTRDEFSKYVTYMDDNKSKIAKHFEELKKYKTKLYSCNYDPLEKIINLKPIKDSFIDPFYQAMFKEMIPYFKGLKAKLENIVNTFDAYKQYVKNFDSHENTIKNMKFSDYHVNKNDVEAQTLLRNTEALFSSTNGYLSSELRSTLATKISDLRRQLALAETQNNSIVTYEEKIKRITNNIIELKKIIPSVIQELEPVKKQAAEFIPRIDKQQSTMDIKDYVFERKELDSEIYDFLQVNEKLLTECLVVKNEKIDRLISEISSSMSELESIDTHQLSTTQGSYASKYEQIKSVVDKLSKTDIPAYEEKLKKEHMDQLDVENQFIKLTQMGEKKQSLLATLTSKEASLDADLLTTLTRDLTTASDKLNKVTVNNNNFQRLLTSQKSMLLSPNGEKLHKIFSTHVDKSMDEINSTLAKIIELQAKINNIKENIDTNRNGLNQFDQIKLKISSDHAAIQSAKTELSKHLGKRYKEFKSLFDRNTNTVNLNIADEISEVNTSIDGYKNAVDSIEKSIDEINGELNDLRSAVNIAVKKTSNIESTHSGMVESLTLGLKTVKSLDDAKYTQLKKKLSEKLDEYKKEFKQQNDNQTNEKSHYSTSVTNAENLIKRIQDINENKQLKELIEDELSVENNLGSIKQLIDAHGQLVSTGESNLYKLENDYIKHSTSYDEEKKTYDKNYKAIQDLLNAYDKYENDDSHFLNDSLVNDLLNVKSELEQKYKQSESSTDSMNHHLADLNNIDNTLDKNTSQQIQSVKDEMRRVNGLKESIRNYFSRLQSLKQIVDKINEAKVKLGEKRELLVSFQGSLESQNTQNEQIISSNEQKIKTSFETENESLKAAKVEIEKTFVKYDELHKELKNKADKEGTDVNSHLDEEYINLVAKKNEIDRNIETQRESIKNTLSEGIRHCGIEKTRLEKDYSSQNTQLKTLLQNIDSLLNDYVSTDIESNGMAELNDRYTSLIKNVDNLLDNRKDLTITEFNEEIKANIPHDASIFETNIATAIENDKKFFADLKNNESAKNVEVIADNNEDAVQETLVSPQNDITDDQQYSAVKGESKNIVSTDFFKYIMAGAAIATICLAVGGAILKYRSLKKREIYNKCENIYIKA